MLISEVIAKFSDRSILVIGDVILNQYIWENVTRISPEAPVPVIEVASESFRLGGAANVVANISSLGGQVMLIRRKMFQICLSKYRGDGFSSPLSYNITG